MIFYLYLAIAFLLGAMAAIIFAAWSLRRAVDMANIQERDKRMIKDVLGLPND